MTARDELLVAEREDMTQQAVLSILLEAHPGQRSIEEVVREMTDRPDEFPARDAINNALRDLVGTGLLHRHGPFVFATRAAVRFEQLRI
jgi:Fe2+ or Zn2+ uptake regulation protein